MPAAWWARRVKKIAVALARNRIARGARCPCGRAAPGCTGVLSSIKTPWRAGANIFRWLTLALVMTPFARAVSLPAPRRNSGYSLERTLAARQSVREFSGAPLRLADLAQLAWAAGRCVQRRPGSRRGRAPG